MIHADRRFSEAVEATVAELEKATDAEVVVVAAERSGSYRDLALQVGSAAAFAVFVGVLMLPWPVHPAFAIADVLVTQLVVTWLVSNAPWLARLAGESRRDGGEHGRVAPGPLLLLDHEPGVAVTKGTE